MSAATATAPVAEFPPVISDAVLQASTEFFAQYCGLDLAEHKNAVAEAPCPGIMGVISFFGDPVWSFAIVLPETTAVFAAKKFAGFDIPFGSADMGDMVGEMANVIAGDICARLDARGIKAQMSLPTMARGHDVELLPPSDACTSRMALTSTNGNCWFKLVKAKTGHPSSRRPGT